MLPTRAFDRFDSLEEQRFIPCIVWFFKFEWFEELMFMKFSFDPYVFIEGDLWDCFEYSSIW